MPRRAKTIDDLLADRDQFEAWLARLNESQDLASEKVRTKVQADYESRLAKVMEELGSHGDSIRDQLAEHREKESDLTSQESDAREELAEAEVRHAVGEYDQDEWRKLKDMADEQIDRLETELAEVKKEIERLASVQALISAPPQVDSTPAPREASSGAVADQAAASVSQEIEATVDAPAPGAPKFTPRGAEPAGASGPPKTLKFPGESSGGGLDELDFLKSVSEDDKDGPSSDAAGREAVESESPGATADVSPSGDTGSSSKTLKCGECGELNRPTEWYCERCGAELASL
jgi:hypothetical protein